MGIVVFANEKIIIPISVHASAHTQDHSSLTFNSIPACVHISEAVSPWSLAHLDSVSEQVSETVRIANLITVSPGIHEQYPNDPWTTNIHSSTHEHVQNDVSLNVYLEVQSSAHLQNTPEVVLALVGSLNIEAGVHQQVSSVGDFFRVFPSASMQYSMSGFEFIQELSPVADSELYLDTPALHIQLGVSSNVEVLGPTLESEITIPLRVSATLTVPQPSNSLLLNPITYLSGDLDILGPDISGNILLHIQVEGDLSCPTLLMDTGIALTPILTIELVVPTVEAESSISVPPVDTDVILKYNQGGSNWETFA